MKVRLRWPAVWFLAGSLVVLGGFFRFQEDLHAWRLQEVGNLLTFSSAEGLSESFAFLVGRMELLRMRAEHLRESEADDLLETRLQLLASDRFPEERTGGAGTTSLERSLVEALVRGLRYLQGKPDPDAARPQENRDVQAAYLWERGRSYHRAVPLYRNALDDKGTATTLRAALLLHLGFCQAFDGSRNDAKASFGTVVTEFPQTAAAEAALKLLKFLEYFEARLAAPPQGKDWITLGRWAYYMADYAKAEVYLKQSVDEGAQTTEATYYLARVAEETGRASEAEGLYRKVLETTPSAAGQAASLRRLYLLGAVYEDKPALAIEAKAALLEGGASLWLERLPPLPQASLVTSPPVVAPPSEPPTTVQPEAAVNPTPVVPHPVETAVPVRFSPPFHAAVAPSLLTEFQRPELQVLRYPSSLGPVPTDRPLDLSLPSWNVRDAKASGPSGWTIGLLSAGVAGLATLGGSLWWGSTAYQSYKKATSAADLTQLHDQLTLIQTINLASAGLAAAGLAGGGALWWLETADPVGTTEPQR